LVRISRRSGENPWESDGISSLTELEQILEAILFSASKPIILKKLQKGLPEFTVLEIESALRRLVEAYNAQGRAVEIVEVSAGFQMRTKPDHKDWVKRFVREKDVGLTRAVLETLAVVAYRQPIAKREIDSLRGVDSIRCVRLLLDRKLIEIAGRNQEAGKPMIFRTTKKFLETFGLRDISDLPTIKELEALEK
jgi:segregation and condensation protein B